MHGLHIIFKKDKLKRGEKNTINRFFFSDSICWKFTAKTFTQWFMAIPKAGHTG